jgi:hypothetical protein
MTQLAADGMCANQPEGLELTLSQLKVARVFADFSLSSYSVGKLQHATDARYKAEYLCRAAAAWLAGPETDKSPSDLAESMLRAVLNTLANLPELNLRARAVG